MSTPLALSLYTPKELETTIADLCRILKDNTTAPWTERLAALRKLQALVEGGCQHFDNFPALLKQLRSPLTEQVLDLRSAVVKEATATLALLGARLGDAYEAEVDHFVPALFKLLGVSIAIIKESGNDCLRSLLCSAPKASKPLTKIFEGCGGTSSALRLRCMEYVLLLLEVRNKHVATRFESTLQVVLKARLCDRHEEVRHKARQSCCAYLSLAAIPGGTNATGSAEMWLNQEIDEKTRRLIRQEQVAYEGARQGREEEERTRAQEQEEQKYVDEQPEHHLSPPTSPSSQQYQSATAHSRRVKSMQEEKEILHARNRSTSAVRRARSSLSALNATHRRSTSIPPAQRQFSAPTAALASPRTATPSHHLDTEKGESRRISTAYRAAREEEPLASGHIAPSHAFNFEEAQKSPSAQPSPSPASTITMTASARGRSRVSLGGMGTMAGVAQSARRASSTRRPSSSMSAPPIAQQAFAPYGSPTNYHQKEKDREATARLIGNSPAPPMATPVPAESSVRKTHGRVASASRGRTQAPSLTSTHAVGTHLPLSPTSSAPRNAAHVHPALVDPSLNPSQRAQLIVQLIEQGKEPQWNRRVAAFEGLAALFAPALTSAASSASASPSSSFASNHGRKIPELWLAQQPIIFSLKSGLGDPHHKVAAAVLRCVGNALVPSGAQGGQYSAEECKPVLDRLLADVFACLSHGRLSIREQANALLNQLTSSFPVDLLLAVLIQKCFDAIQQTHAGTNHAKVRLGVLEFIHYLIPLSGEYFRTVAQTETSSGTPVGVNGPLRLLLMRIAPFLSSSASASTASGDPKLKKLALSVCHTLYLGFEGTFFPALACLPVPMNRLVRRALVESLPEIEQKIVKEGMNGGKTWTSQEQQRQQLHQQQRSEDDVAMRTLDFDRSSQHGQPSESQHPEMESSPWDTATTYSAYSTRSLPAHSPQSTYSMPFQQQPNQAQSAPKSAQPSAGASFSFDKAATMNGGGMNGAQQAAYSPNAYADAPYSTSTASSSQRPLPGSTTMTRAYSAPAMDPHGPSASGLPYSSYTPQSAIDSYSSYPSVTAPHPDASLLSLLATCGASNLHQSSRRSALERLSQLASSEQERFSPAGWERMLLVLADGLAEACQENPRSPEAQSELATIVLSILTSLVRVHMYAFHRMMHPGGAGTACMELLLRSLLHALRSTIEGFTAQAEMAQMSFAGIAEVTPMETLLPLLLQQVSTPPTQRTAQDEAALKLVLQTLTNTIDHRLSQKILLHDVHSVTGEIWLDVIVHGLAACTAEQVLVRKLVISAFVAVYAKVGEELLSRLGDLPPILRKLILVYTQKYDEKQRTRS